MADTEQGMADETQAPESSDSGPEIMDAGASSGGPEIMDSGASSGSTSGDFTQVKPLSESEDPAHANFLPGGHDTPEELISDREEGES